MDELDLHIDPDIARAEALPPRFYKDPAVFEHTRERVLARGWHCIGDTFGLETRGSVRPLTLLEGALDEPLFLARDEQDALRCFANVCTHRGNTLIESAGVEKLLRCRYHGRSFGLDGRFRAAPEFGGAKDFPRPEDDLARVPLSTWGKLLFASLEPVLPFEEQIAPLAARLEGLPIERLVPDASRSRDYTVRAHWALYCDNYLEGFHIPFVHPGLNTALEFSSYRTELFPWASLQVGIAAPDELAFELPRASPDFGQRIAGYFAWLFPCTMLNFYPWGLSLNIVQPRGLDTTVVAFRTYVWDAALLGRGAGADLARVEAEDESVVEGVQRGVRSRFCPRARYSPSREQGVHHFHRLLAAALRA